MNGKTFIIDEEKERFLELVEEAASYIVNLVVRKYDRGSPMFQDIYKELSESALVVSSVCDSEDEEEAQHAVDEYVYGGPSAEELN